ncbi:MAG TPA: triose-phosphate isomerase [Gemmatimonadaceae bacterium]|jgi:triosephosphate isomerase
MRTRIFAANWKMNHGPTAAAGFIREFRNRWTREDAEIAFFPSALAFAAVRDAAGDPCPFKLGVQNVNSADRGAFTGENSAPMAKDAGADYVLVGHSERRHVFGETDADCAAKCAIVERSGLTPLLCVGETLAERERGETSSVVTRQLREGLSKLDQIELTTSIIAYEPVWAIGTGKNATPADAARTHGELRAALSDLIGDRAALVSILYGGSVTPANAAEILAADDVDGVLVGGASLQVDSWLSICNS